MLAGGGADRHDRARRRRRPHRRARPAAYDRDRAAVFQTKILLTPD